METLLNKNLEYTKEIKKVFKTFNQKNICLENNLFLKKILCKNKFEKLVPFNLWFNHSDYKVENFVQQNQNHRIRYYNNQMLTPLVTYEDLNIKALQSFLPNLSLYQPFYPETFYGMWEFLKMNHCPQNAKFFLSICKENKLGFAEAIVFFHEKTSPTYQQNVYHSWLAENETYDSFDMVYHLQSPKVNYLNQAYNIKFLHTTSSLINYDFICIDVIQNFNHVFDWKTENNDLQATIFYFLTAFPLLNKNGAILVKIALTGCKSWTLLFDFVYENFKEYTFIRPTCTNNLNPEVYLFACKPKNLTSEKLYTYNFFKTLYRWKTFELFNLVTFCNKNNPILKIYQTIVTEWTTKTLRILNNLDKVKNPKKNIDYVTQWHKSHNLLQIKDLENNVGSVNTVSSTFLKLVSATKIFEIKLLHSAEFIHTFYKTLVSKRADLNYYKRILDTKPSCIFSNKITDYQTNKNYLLGWEDVTKSLSPSFSLKQTIKKEFNAEIVTNAWMKMYEILNSFPQLLQKTISEIKSFHLCEAPGAFISALNHYLSGQNQKLNWFAQTLVQTSAGLESDYALDDHYGLIAAYPDRWLFGNSDDSSGDITHSTLIRFYANNPVLKNIDFMTADAGLSCHPANLNEQESHLGKLNMGQIICILACLSVGKSAIFKTFLPLTEPLSISMMFLVTNLFKTVTITKPLSSHSSNSEVYVVLENYKGINTGMLDILYYLLDDPKINSKTLLFSCIDSIFFKSYVTATTTLISNQISSLSMHYYAYYHFTEIIDYNNQNNHNQKNYVENWLKANKLSYLQNKLL